MASIDRGDWHYDGDYPKELPIENGGTHIGMFINWIIDNDLIGALHLEDSKQGIQDVKARKVTGREFLFEYCDGKFWEDDLNEEGLAFTNYYYLNPDNPDDAYGKYIEDYERTLGTEFESFYEISNTWENYEKIEKQISTVYNNWKNKRKKKLWQFWKK